jgi:hypothetical protein
MLCCGIRCSAKITFFLPQTETTETTGNDTLSPTTYEKNIKNS